MFGQKTGFGSTTSSTGFGQKPGGFGTGTTSTTGFGQKPGGFGTGTTSTPSGFGQKPGGFGTGTTSTTSTGFGQKPGGFGTPTTTGFGTGTTSTTPSGFGQKPSGFGTGTTSTTPSGFGQKPGGFGTPTTGFGQKPTGFGLGTGTTTSGGLQQQQPPSDVVVERLPQQYHTNLIDPIYNRFNENEKIQVDIETRSTDAMKNFETSAKLVEEKLSELSGILDVDIQASGKQKKGYMELIRKAETLSNLVDKIDKQMNSTETYLWNYQVTNLPTEYFKELLIEFENKMSTYKKSIESIESYINSNTNTKNSYSPEVLQDVMKHQMELFISLASQVGQIHERIEDLKHRFRAIEL